MFKGPKYRKTCDLEASMIEERETLQESVSLKPQKQCLLWKRRVGSDFWHAWGFFGGDEMFQM